MSDQTLAAAAPGAPAPAPIETFATPDDLGDLRASELHSSLGEELGAEGGDALMGGMRSLWRATGYFAAQQGWTPITDENDPRLRQPWGPDEPVPAQTDIPIADAKARIKQEGLERQVTLPDQPSIGSGVLQMMIRDGHDRAQTAAAIARGPQGFLPGSLGLATQIGAGMIDPVNMAAFSIPVLGEARYGQLLVSAGESVLKRAALRTGIGAAQGAVGGAAMLPLDWWLHTQDGSDFTYADALKSVAMSAGMGAAAHGGVGLFGDVNARLTGRALPGSLAALQARAIAGDTHAAAIVEKLGGAGTHLPEAALAPEGVDLDEIPGVGAAARPPGAEAPEMPAVSSGPIPPHPAEVLADLPPAAQEDVVHAAAADIIAGEPVRAGQVLQEAAKTDPRIAESVDPYFEGEPAPAASGSAQPLTSAADIERVVNEASARAQTREIQVAPMPTGANSVTGGPVIVDPRIPEEYRRPLAVHETVEEELQARGFDYLRAHQVATKAERAAVEAAGLDWGEYTHRIDGFLNAIEHEHVPASQLPKNLHVDVDTALGHHRSENKQSAAGAERGTSASVPFMITRDMKQRLADLGYALAEIKQMKPERAQAILARGESKAASAPAPHPGPLPQAGEGEAGAVVRAPGENWSLNEFLASRGGIDPDDPQIGDVRGSIGRTNKFVPGFGHLIRKGGMRLDRAREAATEAGYLPGEMAGGAGTRVNDLLDAMDRELRGQRVYRQGHEGAGSAADRARAEEEYRVRAGDAEGRLDQALREVDIDPNSVAGPLRARTVEIMLREGVDDPVDAYERAVMEERSDAAETGEVEPFAERIPGWDEPDDGGGPPAGGNPAEGGGDAAGGGAGGPSRQSRQADRAARPQADWRSLAKRDDPEGSELDAASRTADKAPAPPDNSVKAISAAQAAASKADELLADMLPTLSEDERKAFEDALADLKNDEAAREQIVRDGAACLAQAAM